MHLQVYVKKVLLICTGNTCRSQMAESMLRHLQPNLQVSSAGTAPGSQVSACAIRVLHQNGFATENLAPKHVQQFKIADYDLVLTLCDNAHMLCLPLLQQSTHLHRNFFDPYGAQGTEAEQDAVYERVRSEMEVWLRTTVLPRLAH